MKRAGARVVLLGTAEQNNPKSQALTNVLQGTPDASGGIFELGFVDAIALNEGAHTFAADVVRDHDIAGPAS